MSDHLPDDYIVEVLVERSTLPPKPGMLFQPKDQTIWRVSGIYSSLEAAKAWAGEVVKMKPVILRVQIKKRTWVTEVVWSSPLEW